MSFTQRELQAMARLSPARRRAICSEVYRETTRTAYLTADQYSGVSDAGMGKSLVKRYRDKAKEVVGNIVDSVKAVVNRVEDVARKVAEGTAAAIRRMPTTIKKNVRKGAAVLVVGMPALLAIKSVRKNAAAFYRKNGPLIITATGAILAPFTAGLSVVAASLFTTGKKLYDAKLAAEEAKKAAKAEAAAMAAAVAQQEAELLAQCDGVYNDPQCHDNFLVIGLTPDKWAALSLESKLGIIDDLSNGRMPPGYSFTPQVEVDAETERVKAQNDELDGLYVKYQEGFEDAGIAPDYWYSLTVEQKIAVLQGLSTQTAGPIPETQAPPSEVSTPEISTPSQPSVPSTPTYYSSVQDNPVSTPSYPRVSVPLQPLTTFSVSVEGDPVGVFDTLSEATEKALAASKLGDRVQIYEKGKGTTLGIRTDSGIVPVPEDQVAAVQALSHGEVVSKVVQATAAVGGAKASGGFPWWALAIPAVLFVGAKAKGA